MAQINMYNLYAMSVSTNIDELEALISELNKFDDFDKVNEFLRDKYDITTKDKKVELSNKKSIKISFQNDQTLVSLERGYENKGDDLIFFKNKVNI